MKKKKKKANNKSKVNTPKGKKNNIPQIRIGYIYEDFAEGEWRDFLLSYLGGHDKLRYEVFAYNLASLSEEREKFFAEKHLSMRVLGYKAFSECLDIIKKDKLDILVDLSPKDTPQAIKEILAQKVAYRQLSIAEDWDGKALVSYKLDAIISGESEEYPQAIDNDKVIALKGPKYCYAPYKAVHKYAYRTPRLDRGITTIGLIGQNINLEQKKELGIFLADLLQALPSLQVVISPGLAIAFDEDDFTHLETLGTDDTMIVVSEEMPLEAIDFAVGIGIDCLDFVRFIDKSVPIVTAGVFSHSSSLRSMFSELELDSLYREDTGELVPLIKELVLGEIIEEYHQELHFILHSSRLMNAGDYMLDWELALERLLYQDIKDSSEELFIALKNAQAKKEWLRVLEYGKQLIAKDKLPLEDILTIAWAYYFLDDSLRTAKWAKEAADKNAPQPLTQVYLQIDNAMKQKDPLATLSLGNRGYELIEQGEPTMLEIDRKLAQALADSANVLGGEYSLLTGYNHFSLANSSFEKCQYYSNWLFFHNSEMVSPQEVYEKSLGYNDLFEKIQPFEHKNRRKKEKIRIGYISPDFRQHVMQSFLWPMLATYDSDRFEVYAYSLNKPDQYSEVFTSLVDKWRDFSDSFDAYAKIAKCIYDDEIDILVDLAGHTAKTGLPVLAYKPAPLQISGLGYMATTGLKTVDYFLTDSHIDPEGVNEKYFTERLLRLKSQFCYNGYTNLPQSEGTPAREKGYIQLASFNQYKKIKDEVLLAWLEIMKRVPSSRLLLKNGAYEKPDMCLMMQARLKSLGFDLSRVAIEKATADYMQEYLSVDIALDTYPWPGGGTTADALYMGVPVISLYGSRHSSRFTYSMLANVGLAELASEDINDYITKAVNLASDLDRLDYLHQNLRRLMKNSPLMNQEGYIRDLEEKYLEIWAEYNSKA